MDTMRNNRSQQRVTQRCKLQLRPVAACMLLGFGAAPVFADIEIIPSLQTASHGYEVERANDGKDRGFAQNVTPGLVVRYQASWLQSSLSVDHDAILYRDEQRDNSSYSSYRFDNRANFWRDQLQLQMSAASSHQASGGLFSRYADEITGGDQLAKFDSKNASLNFNNTKLDWLNTRFSLSANESATDLVNDPLRPENGLTDIDLANRRFGTDLNLGSARRNSKIFWDLGLAAYKTDREVAQDFYNRSGNATLGVTVFSGLALIGRGAYESNGDIGAERFAGFRDFKSFGGGFEWRFSERSWWNLTLNKIDNQQGESDYIGSEFSFQPSRRTRLTGTLDRRFFGRTAQVVGSYNLKHFNMQANFSDSVDSLLGFNNNGPQFGLFLCPPGAIPSLENCIQPPSANYQPQPGEQFFVVPLPPGNLNESLVVRRNGSYTFGYNFNRLKLQLQLGARRDLYLERDAETRDNYVTASANWTLSQRNSVTLTSSLSDVEFINNDASNNDGSGNNLGFGQQEGTQSSTELSFVRNLNRQLTGTLAAKTIKADFQDDRNDYRENRLSLRFEFKF